MVCIVLHTSTIKKLVIYLFHNFPLGKLIIQDCRGLTKGQERGGNKETNFFQSHTISKKKHSTKK